MPIRHRRRRWAHRHKAWSRCQQPRIFAGISPDLLQWPEYGAFSCHLPHTQRCIYSKNLFIVIDRLDLIFKIPKIRPIWHGLAMTTPINMPHLALCLQTFATDVREGFVEITRHGLAIFGLAVVLVSLTFLAQPELQASASEALFGWLEFRQSENQEPTPQRNAANRSTVKDPKTLTPEQLLATRWLSRKYRVSAEPLSAMVAEAWALGERSQLPPSLILAIMAVQSRFNPFVSATPGQVGLMQIDLQAHAEALAQFGGPLAAFDPLTNLRLGVRHLQGLMQQTENLEEALALYGVSSGFNGEGQFVDRVLAEQVMIEKSFEKASPTGRVAQ
ncbi:hypothetical protein B9Z40_10330 [Limnohabitans sp. 15K]|nr:hypothetical protein B9Z40_10330 [Limnohabitans sp. 15K]